MTNIKHIPGINFVHWLLPVTLGLRQLVFFLLSGTKPAYQTKTSNHETEVGLIYILVCVFPEITPTEILQGHTRGLHTN